MIWLNGVDLRALPLTERRRQLQNILPKGSAIISEALSVPGRGHKLFDLMCAHDLEGVVAKRLKDGYGSRGDMPEKWDPAEYRNRAKAWREKAAALPESDPKRMACLALADGYENLAAQLEARCKPEQRSSRHG